MYFKMFCLGFLVVFSQLAFAQVDLMQSSPSHTWKSIENDSVKMIYPDNFVEESIYAANLVKHYSAVVGQSYDIKNPKKFDLVIRTDVASPNGYVTLMPRRSEWFTSSMFFPSVGSTEWLQTLSIHEYRHVNQMDYFKDGDGTRILYYLMGEMGQQFAVAMGMPSWFMEGDAVWTETKYTDGGRGRSPRFLTRLKALVLSDEIPTFDEFLSGSYKTHLPNQYVYGYVLVSNARKKFGDDIWAKVVRDASQLPHPNRFYYSFDRITGQDFEEFFNETMNDLKTKWAEDKTAQPAKEDYRETIYPTRIGTALYSVKENLDTYPTLVKEENGKTEKIKEINFSKDFMQLHIRDKNAVATEFLPDRRYGHKGFSDLILINLEKGRKRKITSKKMIYNPNLNAAETKIMAVEFTSNQQWNIVEFDLKGKQLNTVHLPQGKFAEARYLNDKKAIAILLTPTGLRSLVEVDLETKAITQTLLAGSRNLIAALNVDDKQNVLFEGQYKGHINIFKITNGQFSQCSNAKIAALTPSSDGTNIHYSDTDIYGSVAKEIPLTDCKEIASSELIDFKYLGSNPSDNYNEFPITTFPEQESLKTENKQGYAPESYGDFDRQLVIPHSWGLTIGRGTGIGFETDNYLRTLDSRFVVGTDPEEGQSFGNLTFNIKKYYPIISLQAEQRKRKITQYITEDELAWEEKNASLSVLVPYIYKRGLYNFTAALGGGYQYTNTDKYEFNDVDIQGPSTYFHKTHSMLQLSWHKDMKARSIIEPWLLSYMIRYDNADQPKDQAISSYRVLQQAVLQTPGVMSNDGFQFSYYDQVQSPDLGKYKFVPSLDGFNSYVFSRGYDYEEVPQFHKISANYFVPIYNPNLTLTRWFYLKRIYGNLFYDTTKIEGLTGLAADKVYLDSYGGELHLETVLARFIPMNFGARVAQKIQGDETVFQAFLASDLF